MHAAQTDELHDEAEKANERAGDGYDFFDVVQVSVLRGDRCVLTVSAILVKVGSARSRN